MTDQETPASTEASRISEIKRMVGTIIRSWWKTRSRIWIHSTQCLSLAPSLNPLQI
jgi:hypothetical protein